MSHVIQTLLQNPAQSALVIIDMQNDFIHPQGAYARGGMGSDQIRALPGRLKDVADQIRARGGWVISTQFTLLTDQQGQPMISPHLKAIRPFLREGDFVYLPGSETKEGFRRTSPASVTMRSRSCLKRGQLR